MALTVAATIAVWMLGLGPASVWSTRHGPAWRLRLAERGPSATIEFLDGPRAGSYDRWALGVDGRPPLQICAAVRGTSNGGGDYTLPYQRALLSDDDRVWLYTEGWNHVAAER